MSLLLKSLRRQVLKASCNEFHYTPIGGVDEIGGNLTLIEYNETAIIIDCGLLFPDSDLFGINYLTPDFNLLKDKHIEKIFITHGHEDHIGALKQLLDFFPHIQIYATKFSLGLIKRKLGEGFTNYVEVDPNKTLDEKYYSIDYIQVNHSIPETFGLLLRDKRKQTCLFHVSDFKVDKKTNYEPYFNFNKLKSLSKIYSNKYLFADSTNILNPGHSISESEVKCNLQEVIKNHPQTIYITMFSSNIHRIQSVYDICRDLNREIVIAGKSLERYIDVAIETKNLQASRDRFRDESEAKTIDAPVVLVTGCQGEFFGTMKRVSRNEHKHLKIKEGDLVIFSSWPIPGNEVSVYNMMNSISKLGAKLITNKDALIHASGHACQEDLKELIHHYRPTHYVPIHGESFFLKRHALFIQQEFPHINTGLIYNGQKLICSETLKQDAFHEPNLFFILNNGEYIERAHVSKRRKLATSGVVAVSYFKKETKFIISSEGIPDSYTKLFPKLEKHLQKTVHKSGPDAEVLRVQIRRFYDKHVLDRPIAIVHVI